MTSASSAAAMDEVTTGNLDALVGYHLRRALAVVGNDFARALDGTAMRQVPFAILAMVEANPGINQGAVGRALGIQRANMVSLINELVDRDLLDRQIAPDDRRAFSLSLTAAGKAMFEDCLARIHAHEDHLLSDFSAAERRTLIDLLGRIEARER